ncbi:unnamed protein product [Owenia fusiformis]|uniref:Uncharacterized protein n=1 Tax=Owenia fusiformis TaxID=6347 RepID=A0A8J1UTC9_OWEFU|nr:unnamed protein product [Owenia fusiformis]
MRDETIMNSLDDTLNHLTINNDAIDSCPVRRHRGGSQDRRNGRELLRRGSENIRLGSSTSSNDGNHLAVSPTPRRGSYEETSLEKDTQTKGRALKTKRHHRRRHTVVVGSELSKMEPQEVPTQNISEILQQFDMYSPIEPETNTNHSDDKPGLYRCRSFKRTARGIKNKGECLKFKSNPSTQVASDQAIQDDRKGSIPSDISDETTPVFKVALIGSAGVGKTSLAQQCMTSEYMGGIDAINGESADKTVSVLLDGEESVVSFVEIAADEDHTDHCDVDAYVIVYSVIDKRTLRHAVDMVKDLRQVQKTSTVFLIGNKTDIVRQRQINKEEGLEASKNYDCKFKETSAVLNHHIDELLVDIVSTIRHRLKQGLGRRKSIGKVAKGFLKKILKPMRVNSNDNLRE